VKDTLVCQPPSVSMHAAVALASSGMVGGDACVLWLSVAQANQLASCTGLERRVEFVDKLRNAIAPLPLELALPMHARSGCC
jgi:hypothetical protein